MSGSVKWTHKDVLYMQHLHTHQRTKSTPALTVTDPLADKSPHVPARARRWGSPAFLQAVPPKAGTSRKLHNMAKSEHTLITYIWPSTKTKNKNPPPPIQVPAFYFTPLYLLSLPLPLPYLSAASQPIRAEMTSWCCSQCGGRAFQSVMGEKGRHRQTPQEY